MSAEPPPAFRPLGALLLIAAHYAGFIGVLFLGSIVAGRDYGGLHFAAAAAVIGPLTAIYVGLRRWAPTEPIGAALGLERPEGREWARILLGVVAGLGVLPAVQWLAAWGQTLVLPAELPAEMAAAQQAELADPSVQAFLLVAGVVAVPVAMELLFRGFIQPRLAKTIGWSSALALTLALMVLLQGDPRMAPAALALALPLGFLRASSQGVWPVLAGHVAAKLALLAVHLAGYELETSAWTMLGGSGIALAATALALRR